MTADTTSRRCPACGENKPLAEFYRHRTGPAGRTFYCAGCMRARTAAYRAANIEKTREASRRWRAAVPGRGADACRRSRVRHKAKRAAEYRAWTEANRDKLRAYAFARQARKRNAMGGHSPRELGLLMHLYDNRCAYCGGPATAVDHIVPLSRGGSNFIFNLMPACLPCNSSKRSRRVEEWRPELMENAEMRERAALAF